MSADFLGGGIVFALAAALWVAYLIPSWLRRRHFRATEALAEGGIGGTGTQRLSLRERRRHDRALVNAEREVLRASRASRRASRHDAEAGLSDDQRRILARHRRKNQRLFTFIFLLVSLAAIATGVAVIGYLGSPVVLVGGIVATLAALVTLSALSSPAAERSVTVARRSSSDSPAVSPSVLLPLGATREWTPQPLPKPLQHSVESESARTIARQVTAEAMRRALAEQAYLDSRDGIAAAQSPQPTQTTTTTPSFRNVGVVDDVDKDAFSIDEALRRRRAG